MNLIKNNKIVLAGDAGGTKTRLGLFRSDNDELIPIATTVYNSSEYGCLSEIISEFLNGHGKVDVACIGVPGPVSRGKAKTTNLPWDLDRHVLSDVLKIDPFILINDLAAAAYSIPYLKDEDFITLYDGRDMKDKAISVVLAPGTGLGQAILLNMETAYRVISSEGGHRDFAPVNEMQVALLDFLTRKFGHVSYERVVSGQGIVNIYQFLKETKFAAVNENIDTQIIDYDSAPIISKAGLSGECVICEKTLDIFAAVLGAQAGNLALDFAGETAIYIGGGIPPKLIEKLKDGTLLAAYKSKGRLSYIVEKTPLYLINDSASSLKGAAYMALSKISLI